MIFRALFNGGKKWKLLLDYWPKRDIWKRAVEKSKTKMQSMLLSIHSGKRFKESFENAQWRKVKKCNQCNFASIQASNLGTYLKTHNGKSRTNASDVAMHLLRKAIWGRFWKRTVEKSQTNAINVTLRPFRQAIWGHIWKRTMEKSQTNATNVTMHLLRKCTV